MSSLRARLVAGLVALAAAGLIVAAAVTYAEQRSFQLDRIDQQVHGAVFPLSGQLDRRGPSLPSRRAPDGDDGHGPGDHEANFPYGTYGERRDAGGRRVATLPLVRVGQTTPQTPQLPRDLPLNKIVSVDAGGTHYRVLAVPDISDTGTTVVAVPLREVDQTLHRLLLVEALVIGAVLLLLAALAFGVVRIGLRPLERMAATAGKIAGGDLSHRVEPDTERTEVGRLGRALNGMLARLEEAFARREASEDRLRQFLADASHELRTPLSSIRGYAELHRMGAMDDTDTAMKRIEEEATRMGILVEDLLALARLDEIREPRNDSVALDDLARDAVEDARATAPDRDIVLDAPRVAPVLGDPDQLRQVFANLLRNALVHTPPGTPVAVTLRDRDDAVELVVRDHGHGLPPGDPARLFERFWRAEGGRERGRAGSGLGLAIVGAIVAEHHGTVTAANAPDGGAIFTVRLVGQSPESRATGGTVP
jgi:two-component system, OmpR family, sensor kinase